jgi:uncharacterized C2H2 Zn-finger protein
MNGVMPPANTVSVVRAIMSDGDSIPLRQSAVTMSSAAPVPCPECRSLFPTHSLGQHLQQAHKYQFFRGLWRSPAAAADDALAALAIPHPHPDAWRVLTAAATDLHGPRAVYFLAASLGAALERVPEASRDTAVGAVATVLADANAGAALAAALASDDAAAAHLLTLALLARMPPPLEAVLFQPAQSLLLDRRLPAEGQLAVAALLLRSVRPDDPQVGDFLQTLIGGLGRSRSIERLRELERRVGRHPAIDATCARLEERLRMACPRCGLEMRRPDMIRHLWEEHRLGLAGRRVREPRGVIDEWIEAYLARPDPELLERCRILSERLDPERGAAEINRMFLRRGIADPEARAALLQEAVENHASLCPACFTEVPVPREIPPFAISERGGRLSSHGYMVEIHEMRLFTRVDVHTPKFLVFRGQEPGRQLTVTGAVLLIVGPLVLLTLVAAWKLPDTAVFKGVLALLGVTAAAYGLVLARWRSEVPLLARARNYAWTLLAPQLHEGGLVSDDAAFLAGLADACAGDGYARGRTALLPTLLARTERAVIKGQAPPSFLAPLLRLAIEDATAGADPIPMVAHHLARCFEGNLPLMVAERLLADWRADWWTKGNLARLRVLVCDRAFGAGFEVRNLLDAGENSPALAEILGTATPHGLAALRLLWSLRATRPWDRCGAAQTVFELAEDVANAPVLARYPDLLLYQQEPRWQVAAEGGSGKMGPAQIILVTSGVLLQGMEFVTTPQLVEVRAKSLGDELLLGTQLFRGPQPLDELARRMELWFRFAFHEFLPMTATAAHWHPPDRSALLRAWGTVPCPECGVQLLPRVGEVGLALESDSARTGDKDAR